MNYFTYSLTLDASNSNNYYKEAKQLSNKILKKWSVNSDTYLNDFMKCITDNKIEDLRSEEEYFMELLLIGLIVEEYRDNSRVFKSVSNKGFLILNNLRKIKYL
jgi:hypothetical protein